MGEKTTPLMKELKSEAHQGHFGLRREKPLSQEELAEAKELGCYVADSKTLTWGGLHTPGTFADRMSHVAYKVHHS